VGKLGIKEALDFLGVLFLTSFFYVQYWEYREDRELNNSYGKIIVLRMYTKLLNYDI